MKLKNRYSAQSTLCSTAFQEIIPKLVTKVIKKNKQFFIEKEKGKKQER